MVQNTLVILLWCRSNWKACARLRKSGREEGGREGGRERELARSNNCPCWLSL